MRVCLWVSRNWQLGQIDISANTVAELTFQSKVIAASTFKNAEVFTLVALFYLFLCVPLIMIVGRLEKRFGR